MKEPRNLLVTGFFVNWAVRQIRTKMESSPTWTRTRNLAINSRSLYQLSYQGIGRTYRIPKIRRLASGGQAVVGESPFSTNFTRTYTQTR